MVWTCGRKRKWSASGLQTTNVGCCVNSNICHNCSRKMCPNQLHRKTRPTTAEVKKLRIFFVIKHLVQIRNPISKPLHGVKGGFEARFSTKPSQTPPRWSLTFRLMCVSLTLISMGSTCGAALSSIK